MRGSCKLRFDRRGPFLSFVVSITTFSYDISKGTSLCAILRDNPDKMRERQEMIFRENNASERTKVMSNTINDSRKSLSYSSPLNTPPFPPPLLQLDNPVISHKSTNFVQIARAQDRGSVVKLPTKLFVVVVVSAVESCS